MMHAGSGRTPEPEFSAAERQLWRILERENLAFRFVQDPVFNLSEAEEEILERLHEAGLEFGILPRFDPTSFLTISATVGLVTQKVEIGVDRSNPRYYSFITRRGRFADELRTYLDEVFGPDGFDEDRYVASRGYVWCSYVLNPDTPRPRPRLTRLASTLFNFDPKEQHFLDLMEAAVHALNEEREERLQFHIYPRETPFGGIELMVSNGEESQPAKVFVKGPNPLMQYHLITENSPLGSALKTYLDAALGEANLDRLASRMKGKFLSLIYQVRHPRSTLEQFEG